MHTRGAKCAQESGTLGPSEALRLRAVETKAVVRGVPGQRGSGGEQAGAPTSGRVGTPSWLLEYPAAPRILSLPPTCSKIYDAGNSLERKGEREIESQRMVICGLSGA